MVRQQTLAHPDIFMVGFFVENTGHIFSLKWSFSFSLGFGNSASPGPRAHVLQRAADIVHGQRPSGLEPESRGMAVLAGMADTAGARAPDQRCLRDPRGGGGSPAEGLGGWMQRPIEQEGRACVPARLLSFKEKLNI